MENQETKGTEVKVIKGGPLIIMGTVELTHPDGTIETKENRSSYCRCGASKNGPFCDGAHKELDWE